MLSLGFTITAPLNFLLNLIHSLFTACVQQSFFDSGALDTLALALIRQASAADQSVLSYQLSVTISKTLSACITDNSLCHSHTHCKCICLQQTSYFKAVFLSIHNVFQDLWLRVLFHMTWFPTSSLCWRAHTSNQRTGCLFCSPCATALRHQVTPHRF